MYYLDDTIAKYFIKLSQTKLKVKTYLLDSARYVENGSRKSTIWLEVSCEKKPKTFDLKETQTQIKNYIHNLTFHIFITSKKKKRLTSL